ncbi:AI-2E family transporter [Cellulomonas triticagri]|uniref:AI-2E family transporter n=1 Tax=Cellulomonas triticagri TaxID=2483352 RepID=A0A3M2JQ84_9CELL|nr:AI-2E family transporter [Cellulomonas triticagri]RMI13793.1 AI-2E family transporter [Cellulomonas triticagri]
MWFGRRRSTSEAPVVAPQGTPPERGAGALWADGFGRIGTRSVQVLALLAVVAVAVLAITRLTLVVVPVLIALVLASAMYPLVAWLRRRMPSIAATWIALVLVVGVLGGILTAVVYSVIHQWDTLADQAVAGFGELQDSLSGLPIEITDQQIADFRETVTGFLTSSTFGSGAVAGLSAGANFLTGFAVMVVVLFFFLKDGPAIWEFLLRPFEGAHYARGKRIGSRTVGTMGGYVRGTAIVAAVDAIGIGLGLVIMGVPLAIPLSVLVFLLAFIPLVGATLAGVLAALVTLVANGFTEALIVVAIVVVVNQLEGNLLQPVVMARSLALHPLVILVALTVGTVLAGITGAVLAVPIAASIWGAIQVWNGEHEPARPAQQKRRETVAGR